jgi:hypothetical protein
MSSFSLPNTLSPASCAPPRVLFFSHLGELHSRRPSGWDRHCKLSQMQRCGEPHCVATFGEREQRGRAKDAMGVVAAGDVHRRWAGWGGVAAWLCRCLSHGGASSHLQFGCCWLLLPIWWSCSQIQKRVRCHCNYIRIFCEFILIESVQKTTIRYWFLLLLLIPTVPTVMFVRTDFNLNVTRVNFVHMKSAWTHIV